MKIENKKAYIPCEIVGNQINNGLDIRVRIDKTHDLYINRKLLIPDIDQPKLEVPQFVADWYEEHKDNFYLNLHRLAWELIENLDEDDFVPKKALDSDFKRWYHKTETAIQTLNNMHQFGYTVQKEKLYTVEIPNPNNRVEHRHMMLVKTSDGRITLTELIDSHVNLREDIKLTEQEIRKDFDWAWQFAKEVTE
ncbi:DUF1642 domain-containing protein [Streptococcus uberis]|uniref:DUF1642 domain-containing protein n=1 Tax=Streptococcus uberis TaxID=1349 RepID=UPI001FF3E897|nr:DUF1642 domain-containing protein [Streptococcus uberis]MCK1227787.1 DUF1642 domain-containing protein [Streptococcus uberis]